MKKWKEMSTAEIADLLMDAVIGLGAIEFGGVMCADPSARGAFSIALLVVGALGIAGCVLGFLGKPESLKIGLLAGGAVLILGLYRVAASKPDVFLIDFFCVTLGLFKLLTGFLSYRAQHPKEKK